MSSTYKMVIPETVENQIRQLCRSVWDIEWSGILFYKVEGSFEDKNLVITCQDIYPMDIGTTTYTEFSMSPDVANYIALRPELIDCEMGLVHSHHCMDTFFSGTDTNTLLDEGKDRNNFVSLIVNNKGTYSAAITRKMKHDTTIQDTVSYKFFGQGEIKKDMDTVVKIVEEIEYFKLIIEIENARIDSSILSNRLKEITSKKKTALMTEELFPFPYNGGKYPKSDTKSTGFGGTLNPSNIYKNPLNPYKPAQTTLWPDNINGKGNKNVIDNLIEQDLNEQKLIHEIDNDNIRPIPFGKVHYNKDVVNLTVKQLVTCNLAVDPNADINLKKCVNSIPDLFGYLFEDAAMTKFKEWSDFICVLLIENVSDEKLEELGYETEEMEAILANDVMCKLITLDEKIGGSDYLKEYINTLGTYVNIY